MPLTSGTPRWQKLATFVLLVAIFLVVIFIYARAGTTNAAVNATQSSSDRRDCVTLVQNARRSVFDNVTIYTATSTKLLNSVLLAAALGSPLTAEERDAVALAYEANDQQLEAALTEAKRLQPPEVLDALLTRGGTVAGKHYDPCPN